MVLIPTGNWTPDSPIFVGIGTMVFDHWTTSCYIYVDLVQWSNTMVLIPKTAITFFKLTRVQVEYEGPTGGGHRIHYRWDLLVYLHDFVRAVSRIHKHIILRMSKNGTFCQPIALGGPKTCHTIRLAYETGIWSLKKTIWYTLYNMTIHASIQHLLLEINHVHAQAMTFTYIDRSWAEHV